MRRRPASSGSTAEMSRGDTVRTEGGASDDGVPINHVERRSTTARSPIEHGMYVNTTADPGVVFATFPEKDAARSGRDAHPRLASATDRRARSSPRRSAPIDRCAQPRSSGQARSPQHDEGRVTEPRFSASARSPWALRVVSATRSCGSRTPARSFTAAEIDLIPRTWIRWSVHERSLAGTCDARGRLRSGRSRGTRVVSRRGIVANRMTHQLQQTARRAQDPWPNRDCSRFAPLQKSRTHPVLSRRRRISVAE